MLYRTLKRMIERGQTQGMETKLDIFFAANKLTEEEYTELLGMLPAEEESAPESAPASESGSVSAASAAD